MGDFEAATAAVFVRRRDLWGLSDECVTRKAVIGEEWAGLDRCTVTLPPTCLPSSHPLFLPPSISNSFPPSFPSLLSSPSS